MAHYFSAANPSADGDIGPVTIGRVFGSQTVAVDQALGRVLMVDVVAAAPVPSRPLAAVCGDALRASDTLTASSDKVIELMYYREPKAPVASHAIMPFSMLPADTDTVLGARSPYYKGSRLNDKSAKRIIAPVAVIGIGADIGCGDLLLNAGRRIGAGDIAALTMAGLTQVEVVARPRIAVCSVNKYFDGGGDGAATMADGVTPMVLALLARWGVEVDTVRQFDFAERRIDAGAVTQIDAVAAEHDLTIVLGLLGEAGEMRAMRGLNGENVIMEEPIAAPQRGLDGDEYRHVGLYRPADLVRITSGAQAPPEAVKRCKLVMTLRGLPLPVFTAMYTMVKPALDGLSGVGAYPVQMGARYNFASTPLGSAFGHDTRQALLDRPGAGMSRRHGVRWFSGVLANPAPRDAMRHWLQLAKLSSGMDGRMRVHVLPSEEHQVRGMIAAEAMVAIERGEGELAAETIVHYFLLD
jgi:molybdopterin biosynthesis enzyme